MADMFGISQSTVSRIYRRFLPLIGQAVCLHTPARADAIRNRLILIDGTDIPTGNRADHGHNYSGKRRRQGLAIQLASDTEGGLLAVSDPVPGCTHDRKSFADTGWEQQLTDTPIIADSGYQGTHVITPAKKPHGGELSPGDQSTNAFLSGIRSAIERSIAHLKNWKILKTGYRGRLTELPTLIRIITALEFYRLGW